MMTFNERNVVLGIDYLRDALYSSELVDDYFKGLTPTELVKLRNTQAEGVKLFFANTGTNAACFTMLDDKVTPAIVVGPVGAAIQEKVNVTFHELVHYDQWKRGDLVFRLEENITMWKGVAFSSDGDVKYRDLPYEVEAWNLQKDFMRLHNPKVRHMPNWMVELYMTKCFAQAAHKAAKKQLF